MNRPPKFDPKKPKISLRRWEEYCPGESIMRCAILEYESNRGKEAENVSLENVYRSLWGGK